MDENWRSYSTLNFVWRSVMRQLSHHLFVDQLWKVSLLLSQRLKIHVFPRTFSSCYTFSSKIDFTTNSQSRLRSEIDWVCRILIQQPAGNYCSDSDTFCIIVSSIRSDLARAFLFNFNHSSRRLKKLKKSCKTLGKSQVC